MKFLTMVVAILLAGPANAQDNAAVPVAPPAPAPMSRAGGALQVCRGDIVSLCPGLRPGDGKLGQCVRANVAKLSSGCRDALQTMRSQRR